MEPCKYASRRRTARVAMAVAALVVALLALAPAAESAGRWYLSVGGTLAAGPAPGHGFVARAFRLDESGLADVSDVVSAVGKGAPTAHAVAVDRNTGLQLMSQTATSGNAEGPYSSCRAAFEVDGRGPAAPISGGSCASARRAGSANWPFP